MWDKLKSFFNKIKYIFMTENKEVKNSEKMQSDNNKKIYIDYLRALLYA